VVLWNCMGPTYRWFSRRYSITNWIISVSLHCTEEFFFPLPGFHCSVVTLRLMLQRTAIELHQDDASTILPKSRWFVLGHFSTNSSLTVMPCHSVLYCCAQLHCTSRCVVDEHARWWKWSSVNKTSTMSKHLINGGVYSELQMNSFSVLLSWCM